MASIDLSQGERRARRKYEWARARRALLGLARHRFSRDSNEPPPGVRDRVRNRNVLGGDGLLWYGRELRRAVLPGLTMGVFPLALALCANHMGHACMGGQCMTMCLPACIIGGLGAGIGISIIGVRCKQGRRVLGRSYGADSARRRDGLLVRGLRRRSPEWRLATR